MFPDNPMETSVTTPQEDKPYQNGNKRMWVEGEEDEMRDRFRSLKGYLEDEEVLRLIDD